MEWSFCYLHQSLLNYQSLRSREVVYRSASGADRDGGEHALDLDQRAASGAGSRSDRGERARTCAKAVLSEMPLLLLELWREQNPEGHEQTALDFRALGHVALVELYSRKTAMPKLSVKKSSLSVFAKADVNSMNRIDDAASLPIISP
jgi:hypothetical protein